MQTQSQSGIGRTRALAVMARRTSRVPTAVSGLLPWHSEVWDLVSAQRAQDHVPHGLLLQGREGLGKRAFAEVLAASLLCEQPSADNAACGSCRSCHLFHAGAHPDFLLLEPEEAGKDIVISQVRDLNHFAVLTRGKSLRKVAVVAPAERLNRSAANALLKTLEEPPADTLLILVSHSPALLPATVRSRCQSLVFGTPAVPIAGAWLQAQVGKDAETLLRLASGSPLRALKLAEADAIDRRNKVLAQVKGLVSGHAEPTAVAEEWLRIGLGDAVACSHGLVTDLVRLKFAPEPPEMVNLDVAEDLGALSRRLEFRLLFQLLDKCLDIRRAVERNLNLNAQLMLEELAMTWADPV